MIARHTTAHKALLAVALLALVAGCGKKNDVSPPDGQEHLYTYPRDYPAPVPGAAVPDRSAEQDRLSPPSSLSPYPFSREGKTKTYGSSGS